MSSLKNVWPMVVGSAKEEGMPERMRGILREFLQIKALDYLYAQKLATRLSFVGGTSLRIVYGLPRFSEDLDFDNLGVSDREMTDLIHNVKARFDAENIEVELFEKITEGKTYFELRFPSLLKELGISTNPREKLMIKVDYGKQWHGQSTEVKVVSRWGVVQQVVVNTFDQMLVEKLVAYAGRHTMQPRDMYDVIWLSGHGAKLDRKYMSENGVEDLIDRVWVRWEREGVTNQMKRKLAPFLFISGDEQKLDLFPEIIKNVKSIK